MGRLGAAMRAGGLGAILIVLAFPAANSDEHHQSADLGPTDQSLDSLRLQVEQDLDQPAVPKHDAMGDVYSDLGDLANQLKSVNTHGSVQQFVDPDGGTITVGVLPDDNTQQSVGEAATTRMETTASGGNRAKQANEQVQKQAANTTKAKDDATKAKDKVTEKHDLSQ